MLKRGLSGLTLSRNCIKFDYPIVECVRSMLPCCDEVVVSDAGSTDGTLDLLAKLAKEEERIRVVHQDPYGMFPDSEQSFNQWIEMARAELGYDMHLQLDADEILDPGAFGPISLAVGLREPRLFHFVNFWLDPRHTCLWGDGKKLHLMPADVALSSHGGATEAFMEYRNSAPMHPALITYHYSALRHRDAFIAKCKAVSARMSWPFADQDLMDAEETGAAIADVYPTRRAACVPFEGEHPALMVPWMRERGWTI